jgi:hypothetical protein
VVKLHENGLVIATPEVFCAPDTVAVKVTLGDSELDGVNVATVLPALKLSEPATEFPAESLTVNDTVLGTTAWENVAVGAVETATPVAPWLGVTLVTVGAAFGVTALDGAEAGPSPFPLVADTLNV